MQHNNLNIIISYIKDLFMKFNINNNIIEDDKDG